MRRAQSVALVLLGAGLRDADERCKYRMAHASVPVHARADRGLPTRLRRYALPGDIDNVALSGRFPTLCPCDADECCNHRVAHSSVPARTEGGGDVRARFWRDALPGNIDGVVLPCQFPTRQLAEPRGFRRTACSIDGERSAHAERRGYDYAVAPEHFLPVELSSGFVRGLTASTWRAPYLILARHFHRPCDA